VRSGLVTANSIRRLPFLMAFLAPFAFLAGCDGSVNSAYPTTMRYPLRDDLIVVTIPKNSKLFPFAEPPGRLEEVVAAADGLEGGKTVNPKEMKAAEREELRKYLDTTFGTPAEPKVAPSEDEAKEIAKDLLLDSEHLVAGSKLFRRHCLQCHGVTGDGRGPTGPWVNPHPRDYRQGLFKFVSSVGGAERKPRREDLHRTLTVGIDGTSMPSFSILQADEIQDLISYVIHLSIRGDVEVYVTKQALKGELEGSVSDEVASWTNTTLGNWKKSQQPLQPADTNSIAFSTKTEEHEKWAKSVENGYDWFTNSKVGNCVSCHIDFGRQAQFRYDAWGTLARPNNLTAGIYRGGRRPIDLFWRIRGGINPCEMPKNEDEAKVWDLVNFVQALPFPEMLPEGVRNKIYPEHNVERKLAER
jgi:mono/diheme cytochrome c family protein